MMCKTYFHFSRNQDVITGILNFTLRLKDDAKNLIDLGVATFLTTRAYCFMIRELIAELQKLID